MPFYSVWPSSFSFHIIKEVSKQGQPGGPRLPLMSAFRPTTQCMLSNMDKYGPLTRYAKMRVAHAPGMPGTFSPPPVSDPDMHHGTSVSHVPWCIPGSLTSGFLRIRWREKRSQHSQRMRNRQFCVSGKRSMEAIISFSCFQHILRLCGILLSRQRSKCST